MKSFFIEGYGCSLNIAETESAAGFLFENGFSKVDDFKKADFVIINTCSVKQTTEQRMISRIKFLFENKKSSAKLFVTGCLAGAQHESVAKLSKEIIVLDNSLASLCRALGIKEQNFSPKINPIKGREFISIIPASTGCLGACSYCSARIARKQLYSYSPKSINVAFVNALKKSKSSHASKEFWLTSQDLGCYGFDINSSLPKLLGVLLQNKGNYRIRLGMMNPNHFEKIKSNLLPLMRDERVYKFLHLPLQSGSNKILKSMNRGYSVNDFLKCVSYARKVIPSITIATDIIVGFPGETDSDFEKTLEVLKKVKPDIVNISRFGKRKGTPAEKMGGQLTEGEKKDRSRLLTKFCNDLFSDKNKHLVGKEVRCLVSEKAKNGFNARTDEYNTVFVREGFGKFVVARIEEVRTHYLIGKVIRILAD